MIKSVILTNKDYTISYKIDMLRFDIHRSTLKSIVYEINYKFSVLAINLGMQHVIFPIRPKEFPYFRLILIKLN